MTRKALFLLMLAGLTPLYAGSTKMLSSWSAPEARGVRFRKLLAVVVTRSVATRREAEDELVSRLRNRGNDAQASYELLSELELENPASAKAKVATTGADGAVVFQLHNEKRSTKHQPSSNSNGPPITSGNRVDPTRSEFTFFSPHASAGDLSYTERVVEIETLVYSLKDDKLLWRGISRTKNPLGAQVVMREISEQIVKTMKKQGLIEK